MPALDTFISDLTLIMITAAIVSLVFKKIKMPLILGYIVAGFLIGPYFTLMPTVAEVADVNTWSEIGIIFLMFGLGLEFSFMKLAKVGTSAIVTAFTVVVCMIATGYLLGRLIGFTQMDSAFLGCMISMSSTMVILKAFEGYGVKGQKYAGLVLGALVVEDIAGIFMMIVLQAVSVSRDVSGIDLISEISILLLMLIVWLLLGIFLIPTLLKRTRKLLNDEMLLIISLAICFGMVAISHAIGFSEALGAFMGGSILAGTVSGEKIEKIVTPLKDMFGAVFFVSVGMMIEPEILKEKLVPIIIITLVTIFGQMIFSSLGILLSGQSLETVIKGGFSMVQIGEFSFIIASLGRSLGVISDTLYPMIVCVSVISIFTTPVFMKSSGKVYSFFDKHMPDGFRLFARKYTSDRRSSGDNNNDWLRYMKRYVIRTLVTGAFLIILFFAGKNRLMPWLTEHISEDYGDLMACIIILAAMIPVMAIMLNIRSDSFKKLWIMSRLNRLPLTALRALRYVIIAFFIVLTFQVYMHIKYYFTLPLALLIILIVLRSNFMRGQAMNVEARFVANLNEKTLHAMKMDDDDEYWMDDKIYTVRIRAVKEGFSETIQKILGNKYVDLFIVDIIRKGKHNILPGPNELVKKGDTLVAVSGAEQLKGFLKGLDTWIDAFVQDSDMESMEDFIYSQEEDEVPPEDQIICCAIPVTKDLDYSGKSIKNSGFRDKYGGWILALERENLTIPYPSPDTMIQNHDLLWAVGDSKMSKRLLRDGFIKEYGIRGEEKAGRKAKATDQEDN